MPLGPWVIAKRLLHIYTVLSNCFHYQHFNGVMDKAFTFKAEGLRFKSRRRQWNSFKKSKFPFFNEDTLAIVKSEAS